MSLIRKLLNLWGSGGTLEAPPPDADKIDLGYVGDERPYIDRLNWLHNRSEKKLNDLLTQGVSSAHDEATEAEVQAMIQTGLWDQSWGCTDDDANVMGTTGGSVYYRDLATYFNSDGDARVLAADAAAIKIEVWDPRTRTREDISHDLSADLTAATEIQSICTDGTWVYATLRDSVAEFYYVQAWKISNWSVKTAWPVAGTKLTPVVAGKLFKVIIASTKAAGHAEDRLAIVNDATTITSDASPAIEIIDMEDGAILAVGAGDARDVAATDKVADPCIASDGTNVYFCAYAVGVTALYTCSATIADPTAGCAGNDWGSSTAMNAHAGAMVAAGEKIVTFLHYGEDPAYSLIAILTHTAADAILDVILLGQNAGAPLPVDKYNYMQAVDAVFDGLSVWAFVLVDSLNGDYSGGLLKIDVAKFSFNPALAEYRFIDDLEPSMFIVDPQATMGEEGPQNGMTFDGRDIWVTGYQTVTSGQIHRLPLALIRS